MSDTQTLLSLAGFCVAAYSMIANDAIQTIGTFLSSNKKRPWWVLWLFTAIILVIVLLYGWYSSGAAHDVSYGRLKSIPFPKDGLTWIYVVPPFVILLLTRFGVPVSTTFLLLTIFAPGNLAGMVIKSLVGYFVAFFAAILLYSTVIKKTTQYFNATHDQAVPKYWVGLQWLSTSFLWSQWLVQDLANTFVFLPRQVSLQWLLFSLVLFILALGFVFYRGGGLIQRVVLNKTGTTDIRGATVIDFIYGFILLIFKEWSHMPMSTTWVFLGLLAGREFAFAFSLYARPIDETARVVRSDMTKALFGLVVSIVLAWALPQIYKLLPMF
ncbi:MAG: hypothetical protein WDW19_03235 [Neisseriaceae bacterium]